jgi:hypothetical protein
MTQNTTSSPITHITHAEIPYPKSWIDQLTAWIDRTPGPSWGFYVATLLVLAFMNNAIFWIDGSQAVGSFDPVKIADAVLVLFFPALYHHLSKVAGQSFAVFQSALKLPEAELKILDYRLTTMPQRLGWLAIFVGIVISIQSIQSDPASFGLNTAQTLLPVIYQYVLMIFLAPSFVALIFQMLRQLQLVITLHRQVLNVDIFQLTPFHAFARFTARAGVGLVVFVIYNIIYGFVFEVIGSLLSVVVFASVLAVSVFVIPLLGIQRRLQAEKERHLSEANEAIKITFSRIHAQVNSDTYEKIPGLNTTLTALVEQRNFMKQISTWPWDTSTLRGFASTLLVPVFLWLVTTLLERLI